MPHRYKPGQDTLFTSDAPVGSYSAVFEDDAAVAYFYAVVRKSPENQILDAIHIYNAYAMVDRDRESELELEWTDGGQKVTLLINHQAQAIFDFAGRMSRHQANFPRNDGEGWITHEWDGEGTG